MWTKLWSLRLVTFLTFFGLSAVNGENTLRCDFTKEFGREGLVIDHDIDICHILNQTIDGKEQAMIGFDENVDFNQTEGLSIFFEENVRNFPENISDVFPFLITLRVTNCSLEAVPEDSLKSLVKLRELNLECNQIAMIDDRAFDDLVELQHLHLNDNKLKQLSVGIFDALENLTELYMGGNQIQFLSENLFSSLRNLEHLDLNRNDIQFLNENVFISLDNLKYLFLNENRLERLGEYLLRNNENLVDIELEKNFLKFVSFWTFEDKKSLMSVHLSGNICVDMFYSRRSFDRLKEDLKSYCTY